MSEVVPYYARRNESGKYTFRGEEYLSVTTILGHAPGPYLMPWYAKQAALKAASHLWQCGLLDIHKAYKERQITEKEFEELQEFTGELVDRHVDVDAGIYEVARWATTMKQAERYRNHRANVGSVMHHGIYNRTVQGHRIHFRDLEEYAKSIVIDLRLLVDPNDPDGFPTAAMTESLARSAVAYLRSAFEFLDILEPEAIMSGQEAMVVHPRTNTFPGYAGTLDAIYRVQRTKWQAAEQFFKWLYRWEDLYGDRETAVQVWDYKSSNSLSLSFPAQIEAYRHAEYIVLCDTGEEWDMEMTDGCAILHVGPHESLADTKDEYGTLASKAKHTGATLHVYPDDGRAWQAFLGLLQYVTWAQSPTAPLKRPPAPKKESVPRTEVRKRDW